MRWVWNWWPSSPTLPGPFKLPAPDRNQWRAETCCHVDQRAAWPTLSWNITVSHSPLPASRKWPVLQPATERRGIQLCSPHSSVCSTRTEASKCAKPLSEQPNDPLKSKKKLTWKDDSSLALPHPPCTAQQHSQLSFAKATPRLWHQDTSSLASAWSWLPG